MTTFNVGKPSPNKNEMKNASLAMKSRQQVLNEVNKRRTLLQDNSWIKKRPEEEHADENYGRMVLNQYKSQDGLHRDTNEKDDQKALLSRYRSDTTLDRIPGRDDADKGNQLPSLDSQSSKSNELDVFVNTGNTTSPVKKKRQSWMPPPVSSPKVAMQDVEQQKRHSWGQPNAAVNNKSVSTASDKSGVPKMTVYSSEPVAPPKSNATGNDRPATRPKPSESSANKGVTERAERSPDLDDLIKGKASSNNSSKHKQEHQGLDDLIKVNRASNGHDKGGRDLDNLIAVNKTVQKNKRGQELDDPVVIKSPTAGQNKKWQSSEERSESGKIEGTQVDADDLHQVKRGTSCNVSSNHSSPKDTVVYTRIYKNSQFPHDAYEDNIPGKSIKTVYSTSDRAIIEKEMCTYCRKPLGTDAKMILDNLQICCHATCFKCEVCHGPLENLKAGDSIWIYRNTVHCTPCYAKVKASWVY
nr:sciellin isoform X1 [Pogona vitticeps]XP_020639220.1 sciellin isoform X1 [Pogona vitticeps]